MKIAFTKMHGAGNDFVVIDATKTAVVLTPDQVRALADRRTGVGADQILLVQAPSSGEVDFDYRIFNADGHEVEQCGNGARCFARFVRDKGLTIKSTIRVKTRSGVIAPTIHADGTVTVDMGVPSAGPEAVGFDARDLVTRASGGIHEWQLSPPQGDAFWVSLVSMGNPHAVQWVEDLAHHPVSEIGPWLESHRRFAHRVNAGFAQRISQGEIALRVFERGAGETLSCGTGACAAVVSGVLLGLITPDQDIHVHTRGGDLRIRWPGRPGDPVQMTGPAQSVYEGVIEL